ncbi:MAG: YceI family protein [Acidimicrobiia bacterium]
MTTATTNATKSTPAVGVWDIDPAHSHISIIARHLMVTKVRGTFEDLSGTIEVAEDPTKSSATVEARAASVTTGVADRDGHLRSTDFLDAETYPLVTFESTAVTPKGDDWTLTGDLTIRGVTKPVNFNLTYEGSGQDPYGNTKAGFVASGEIDREQFGLTWNVPLEGGGVLVSKNFKIEFEVQAKLRS